MFYSRLHSIVDKSLEIVFPSLCVLCKEEGSNLCYSCSATLTVWPSGLCAWCDRLENDSNICTSCSSIFGLDGLWIGFRYDDLHIAQLVHTLKFDYRESLGKEMGALLTQRIGRLPDIISTVIPIPLDKKRHKERGFNQSLVIARHLAREHNFMINTHLLTRTLSRIPQAQLDATGREHNIKGVYTVSSQTEIPQSVLLIDDVTTTGSTLKEAASVLRAAGAMNVYAAVFAHGTPPLSLNRGPVDGIPNR